MNYIHNAPKSQLELTTMLSRKPTPDLKAPEKLILIVLSTFGNNEGYDIFPSLATLADRCCMSKKALINNLKKLEEKGYVLKKRGGVIDGVNQPNYYMINLAKFGYMYVEETDDSRAALTFDIASAR